MNKNDIQQILQNSDLIGKPVLLEHGGDKIGEIISAWEYQGKLDILVELPEDEFRSRVAGSFVATQCLKDFSLGYMLQMSGNESIGKKVVEVSLVKKGARPNCHIRQYCRS